MLHTPRDPAHTDLEVTDIAAELERLRLLKEYELGVRVEYEGGDPNVARVANQ